MINPQAVYGSYMASKDEASQATSHILRFSHFCSEDGDLYLVYVATCYLIAMDIPLVLQLGGATVQQLIDVFTNTRKASISMPHVWTKYLHVIQDLGVDKGELSKVAWIKAMALVNVDRTAIEKYLHLTSFKWGRDDFNLVLDAILSNEDPTFRGYARNLLIEWSGQLPTDYRDALENNHRYITLFT